MKENILLFFKCNPADGNRRAEGIGGHAKFTPTSALANNPLYRISPRQTGPGQCTRVGLDLIEELRNTETLTEEQDNLQSVMRAAGPAARNPWESIWEPLKTVASGRNAVREAQLYEEYSEHRRTAVQRAAGFLTLPLVSILQK
ncbi:hypothetical protein NX783_03365 [Massilia kyonggiensis]|nr:hypothetical protein [Massilia kyonggiensis]